MSNTTFYSQEPMVSSKPSKLGQVLFRLKYSFNLAMPRNKRVMCNNFPTFISSECNIKQNI